MSSINPRVLNLRQGHCEIAIAQSNKRRREKFNDRAAKFAGMEAFRSKMKARTEREAASQGPQAIAEARSAVEAEESVDENIHDSME